MLVVSTCNNFQLNTASFPSNVAISLQIIGTVAPQHINLSAVLCRQLLPHCNDAGILSVRRYQYFLWTYNGNSWEQMKLWRNTCPAFASVIKSATTKIKEENGGTSYNKPTGLYETNSTSVGFFPLRTKIQIVYVAVNMWSLHSVHKVNAHRTSHICLSGPCFLLENPWVDFHEIWYWGNLRKIVEQLQFSFKWDMFNDDFTRRHTHISVLFLLNMHRK
jgi:hypothetical protein